MYVCMYVHVCMYIIFYKMQANVKKKIKLFIISKHSKLSLLTLKWITFWNVCVCTCAINIHSN